MAQLGWPGTLRFKENQSSRNRYHNPRRQLVWWSRLNRGEPQVKLSYTWLTRKRMALAHLKLTLPQLIGRRGFRLLTRLIHCDTQPLFAATPNPLQFTRHSRKGIAKQSPEQLTGLNFETPWCPYSWPQSLLSDIWTSLTFRSGINYYLWDPRAQMHRCEGPYMWLWDYVGTGVEVQSLRMRRFEGFKEETSPFWLAQPHSYFILLEGWRSVIVDTVIPAGLSNETWDPRSLVSRWASGRFSCMKSTTTSSTYSILATKPPPRYQRILPLASYRKFNHI